MLIAIIIVFTLQKMFLRTMQDFCLSQLRGLRPDGQVWFGELTAHINLSGLETVKCGLQYPCHSIVSHSLPLAVLHTVTP